MSFVIDMDWHKDFLGGTSRSTMTPATAKGWSGYSWDTALFPIPRDFLTELHKRRSEGDASISTPRSGVQPWEDAYPQFARNMGIDPATPEVRSL